MLCFLCGCSDRVHTPEHGKLRLSRRDQPLCTVVLSHCGMCCWLYWCGRGHSLQLRWAVHSEWLLWYCCAFAYVVHLLSPLRSTFFSVSALPSPPLFPVQMHLDVMHVCIHGRPHGSAISLITWMESADLTALYCALVEFGRSIVFEGVIESSLGPCERVCT